MVIGLLTLAAIPTVTGVAQGISAQKQMNAKNKEQVKFNLTAMIQVGDEFREGCFCVLADGRILLDLPDFPVEGGGHRFCGYYFKYPGDEGHLGLVSTIADDPPMLNWIYVDAETREMRYGSRKTTVGHVIGPWGWSQDENFLTLEGDHARFVARQQQDTEEPGGGARRRWCVYWDPENEMEGELRLKLRRRLQSGVESNYVR